MRLVTMGGARTMRRTARMSGRLLVLLALTGPAALVPGAAAPDECRYTSITLRGRLTDPETKRPMAGAVVRFVATEEDKKALGITDEDGRFEIGGLACASYVVDIETADGEQIRGINTLPVTSGETVEVVMKISSRIKTTTSVEARPERFVAVVNKETGVSSWGRFWREFAAFFGATAGLGIAAF